MRAGLFAPARIAFPRAATLIILRCAGADAGHHRFHPEVAIARMRATIEATFRPLGQAFAGLAGPLLQWQRRRRAVRLIERAAPVSSVLFVCLGNVCRSPFAAGVFARATALFQPPIRASSGGFVLSGHRSPRTAIDAAARQGVDLRDHRAAYAGRDAVRLADLVVVMDPEQRVDVMRRFLKPAARIVVLGDLDPVATSQRGIRDPMGCDDAVFNDTYDRIVRCVNELVNVLAALPARAD
jgi:protein-tyrosine phosphatase